MADLLAAFAPPPLKRPIAVPGISGGVRRIIVSKLRERGLEPQGIEAIMRSRFGDAIAYFQTQLRTHQAQHVAKADPETPYSEAFNDLAKWVDALDLSAVQ